MYQLEGCLLLKTLVYNVSSFVEERFFPLYERITCENLFGFPYVVFSNYFDYVRYFTTSQSEFHDEELKKIKLLL